MTMKTNITTFCARAAATLAFPLKRLPVALLMLFTIALSFTNGKTAYIRPVAEVSINKE